MSGGANTFSTESAPFARWPFMPACDLPKLFGGSFEILKKSAYFEHAEARVGTTAAGESLGTKLKLADAVRT